MRQNHDRFPRLANLNAAPVDTCTFKSCLMPIKAQYRMTPLHFAATHGHPDAVGLLCRMGADVDCTHIEASVRSIMDPYRPTQLLAVASRKSLSISLPVVTHLCTGCLGSEPDSPDCGLLARRRLLRSGAAGPRRRLHNRGPYLRTGQLLAKYPGCRSPTRGCATKRTIR